MVCIDNKTNLKLSILPPSSLVEAAKLAADALADNPVYTAICPNDTTAANADGTFRQRFLSWLFERNFRLRLGTSVNRALFDTNGRLIAFFMFVSPDTAHVGFLDMLRVGIVLQAPFLFGFGVVRRLLSTKNEFDRMEQEILAENEYVPMIKLERMVVCPDVQGKGIGSHALKQALDEADEAGLPVLLNTQEERNVQFYGRLGFEVVRKQDMTGYTNWSMLRQPVEQRE